MMALRDLEEGIGPTSSERIWRCQIDPAVRLRNARSIYADDQRGWRLRAIEVGSGRIHKSLRNDVLHMITPFREKPNRIPVAVIPELEGARPP
jgi:hypothetical protein